MSAINFVLSLARKLLARESKGITTIPNQMAVEQKAGEIAATLQSAGVPLNRADEFIKSEQDLIRILNIIESTPPVMREVPSGIRSTKSAKVFNIKGDELDPNKPIIGGTQLGKRLDESTSKRLDERNTQLIKQRIADKKVKTEAEILERLGRENKEGIARIRNRKMIEEAIDNVSPGFVKGDNKYNAEIVAEEIANKRGLDYYDMDAKQRADIYGEAFDALMKMRDDLAQGGRAGFKAGLGKKFLDLIKGKSKLKFDERRFREGPIDLDFLENIDKSDLEKFIRTRDTGGLGGYGMYDNFADMPAGLRAAELIKTIKTKDGGINYKAAELFLGTKLKGNESVDELIQMLNRKEMRAEGGRIGFKDGMTRRTFMKILGGAMAIPIVGKFLKLAKVGQAVKKVPVIKTADVPGKPEWFDQLVNKVITEGDDMTKQFATKEREIVHATKIDEDNFVIVTQDLDEGAVRVEYQSEANVFGDPVQLQYKKPLPDEGAPSPPASFDVAESGPVGRSRGPDDYEIEVDEVGGSNIRELDSDVSKLKEYATGKKLTMKEIVEAKRRRDRAKLISDDMEAQSDAVTRRQGDGDDSFYAGSDYGDVDDYASGGIARLLGE